MLKDSGLSLRCQGTSLFVGDDNLLLRRIDDEYGQQPAGFVELALALTLW